MSTVTAAGRCPWGRAIALAPLLVAIFGALILVTPPAMARGEIRPAGLRISELGVDVPVVAIDIDRNGAMPAPTGLGSVAWYRELGGLGAPDNVVLAGHRDGVAGAPAVFSRLGELRSGDTIAIIGEDGIVYVYRVAWLRVYDVAEMPTAELFSGGGDEERLTLITCTGLFDPAVGLYRQRLVVRAVRRGD